MTGVQTCALPIYEIWIIPTVGCVNDIAKKIVADNQDLVTGSIEGLYTFTHPFGCARPSARSS